MGLYRLRQKQLQDILYTECALYCSSFINLKNTLIGTKVFHDDIPEGRMKLGGKMNLFHLIFTTLTTKHQYLLIANR